MLLKKFEGNPILSPNTDNQWESLVVCNPGAWYENGKFYLYYGRQVMMKHIIYILDWLLVTMDSILTGFRTSRY